MKRNPLILVPVFAVAAVLVYTLLVQPGLARLGKDRAAMLELRDQVFRRTLELQSVSAIQTRAVEVENEIARLSEVQLKPLLESYAMRAKSIIGEYAREAGLVDAEFSDRTPLALPVIPGKPVPTNLHARRPVLVSCIGDYAAIVSFILRVERELPHVALQSLLIRPTANEVELQRADIIFEWPAKGAEK